MSSQTFPGAPAAARPAARWRGHRFVTAGGIGIAAFEAGLSEPDAPVLVLVHGMGHWTQAAWDFVAADFETTHRIVAFDLPGFGASDKPRRAYTQTFFTDVLREVVVDARLSTFALAGHSLGGLIAAHYAVRFPGDVRSLTLIAPAGFLRTPKLVLRVMGSRPVIALLQAIKPSRAFVLRTLESAVFDPATLRSADKERAVELAFDPSVSAAFARVYAGAMRELLHMRKLHARLAGWRGPTLLVWGRQDRFVPFGGLASARKVYPQADVLEIDRCGHCPNIEYPALVTDRMRANGA